MSNFDKCKRAYSLGATKEQLKIWVLANKITPMEYKDITVEDYIVVGE